MRVAFLATGIMGAPMARNLLRAGHSAAVWNRTAEKARALAADGATVADSPAAAAAGRDFVFTMASDGAACDEILFGENGAAKGMRRGALAVVCSSLSPEKAREQGRRFADLGVGYVDAPVSGGERGAREGSLAVMVGGRAKDAERAAEVLRAVGTPVYVGGVGCGQLAKLANQAIVGATIAAVAEGLILAERGGADAAAVRRAMMGGFADSEILRQHGGRMLAGDFAAGGAARYQLRDLRAALAEGEAAGFRMPVSAAAARVFGGMVEAGMGGLDHGGVYGYLKEEG